MNAWATDETVLMSTQPYDIKCFIFVTQEISQGSVAT